MTVLYSMQIMCAIFVREAEGDFTLFLSLFFVSTIPEKVVFEFSWIFAMGRFWKQKQ